MNPKQLIALVITTLGIYVPGALVLTLLPVYAVQLGMDAGSTGLYFSVAFLAVTVGSLASGWLANRLQRRKLLLILTCVVGIPVYFLMGEVSNLLLFTFLTLIGWFWGGVGTATINILVGMYAAPHERGRIFGLMATVIGLAVAIGGFASGLIVDRWGFTGLFTIVAILYLLPLLGSLLIQDQMQTPVQAAQPEQAQQPKSTPARLSRALWLLLLANTLSAVAGFGAGFARPLIMNGMNFDASSISSASGISGLVALPLPFLIAWFSDRVGRKPLLIASYVVTAIGMLLLISALDLWQFWLSASLFSIAGAAGGVATALATDLATPETLSTAMSRFSATPWIASIIGYGATGIVIQNLGLSPTLLIGAALPIVAILALQLSTYKRMQTTAPAPA